MAARQNGREDSNKEENDDAANILIDRHHADFAFAAQTLVSPKTILNYDKINPTKFKDIFDNPMTFDQAWNHPCLWQRAKWREAIIKELKKMEYH